MKEELAAILNSLGVLVESLYEATAAERLQSFAAATALTNALRQEFCPSDDEAGNALTCIDRAFRVIATGRYADPKAVAEHVKYLINNIAYLKTHLL